MDKRIGVQYYTIRKQCQTLEDFEQSCKKVSEIGYRIVQISGVNFDAKEMKGILDKYNLQVVTTHRNFQDFLENLEEVIEYNRILGAELCGIGAMPSDYRNFPERWTDFIDKSNIICQTLKKEKMYFGYHNHSFEFAKINGTTLYERLIRETDPEVFRFIVDTYWVQSAGKNPSDMIRRLGNRAMAVHFKDMTVDLKEWENPRMTEVGNGNFCWDEIIAACVDAGTKWAIVEQDDNHIDEDPFKAIRISYEYLKTKGFV